MVIRDFYIDGTGVHIPPAVSVRDAVTDGLYSAEDLEESRLESIAVASDGFPAEMAADAARKALAASAHDPGDVAVTMYAGISNQGLFGWHPGAYVHRFAVGNDAPAVMLNQQSNGGMAAIDLATAYLAARDGSAALVATGDRFDDLTGGRWNYDDGLIPGDGAAACVISRERGFARILSIASTSNTELEELHRGDSVFVPQPEVSPPLRQRKREYLARHDLAVTAAAFSAGAEAVLDRVLSDASVKKDQVDHWVMPNIGLQELRNYYLDPLGLPLEATLWEWGRTVGHLGAGDQIAGLDRLRRERLLVPGQTIAMVGVGVGFNWSCALLRVESE